MGYITELNTLVGLPKDFADIKNLQIGKLYTILKDRERTFPLHIAMLLVDHEFNFLGYCFAESIFIKDQKSEITIKIISLFTPEEAALYKKRFKEATDITKEFEKI